MKQNCWKCREEFERSDMEEHHLLPKDIFYDDDLADRFRILLCKSCHEEATGKFTEDGVIWMPGPKNLVID